jgi:hypothetical protein
MPSGFLSKFGRDKTSPGAGSLKQQQQQQQQARPAARSPATSAFAQAQTAPPIHSSSIDSTSTSSPTVAGSSAGGSGSSASSSLIAGHMQQSSARTLSGILGGQEAGTTPGSNMSMQQRAQAEASAGVAMAGIPIVQVQGVQQYPTAAPQQQQQDQYSGARQMSVDMMDVSGLSLTGQGNDPVRQAGDEAMRDKMRAAQLQVSRRKLRSISFVLIVCDPGRSSTSRGGIRSFAGPCCGAQRASKSSGVRTSSSTTAAAATGTPATASRCCESTAAPTSGSTATRPSDLYADGIHADDGVPFQAVPGSRGGIRVDEQWSQGAGRSLGPEDGGAVRFG